MSSASRGLAPREGLGLLLLKLGHTRPLVEPCLGPQAGKSGHPGPRTPTAPAPPPPWRPRSRGETLLPSRGEFKEEEEEGGGSLPLSPGGAGTPSGPSS